MMNNSNVNSSKKVMALCEGRHEIPAAKDGAIFATVVDPTDLKGMWETVSQKLEGVSTLELYVTGLTVALGEVFRYCNSAGISLTLYHFNRDTGSYYPQEVLSFNTCPFCGARVPAESWYCPQCGSN